MRRKVIAGNWKMNMLPNEAIEYIEKLSKLVKDTENEVILCVPYTDLFYALLTAQNTNIKIGAQNMHFEESGAYTGEVSAKMLKSINVEYVIIGHSERITAQNTNIKIGAQNMHFEESGAYTGEVSAKMLKSINVEYVIIGHSERRQYFNETDESVNKKVKMALKNGLKPIICVGETLEQREANKTAEVITKQTELALEGLEENELKEIIIAYEPIWAIGTGKTATSEDANNSIKEIRNKIATIYGQNVADGVIIQYGGSVKSKNAKELFTMSDIDGGLVGGASLDAEEFSKIVEYDK